MSARVMFLPEPRADINPCVLRLILLTLHPHFVIVLSSHGVHNQGLWLLFSFAVDGFELFLYVICVPKLLVWIVYIDAGIAYVFIIIIM